MKPSTPPTQPAAKDFPSDLAQTFPTPPEPDLPQFGKTSGLEMMRRPNP